MYKKVKSNFAVLSEYRKQGKNVKATADAMGISISHTYKCLQTMNYGKKQAQGKEKAPLAKSGSQSGKTGVSNKRGKSGKVSGIKSPLVLVGQEHVGNSNE